MTKNTKCKHEGECEYIQLGGTCPGYCGDYEPNLKEKIVGVIQFFILSFVMVMGFFFIYCCVLVSAGVFVSWACVVALVLSLVSEWGYLEWLGK